MQGLGVVGLHTISALKEDASSVRGSFSAVLDNKETVLQQHSKHSSMLADDWLAVRCVKRGSIFLVATMQFFHTTIFQKLFEARYFSFQFTNSSFLFGQTRGQTLAGIVLAGVTRNIRGISGVGVVVRFRSLVQLTQRFLEV
jgi:hypothetical protein